MIAGIVLAAGAGVRAGGPKVLRRSADGVPWVRRAVEALRMGGCEDIVVVLGASADLALDLIPSRVRVAIADDWALGVSASVRAGLTATSDADVTVLSLVDLPGLPGTAVARLIDGANSSSLRRAVFAGRPGHPVVLGSDHRETLLAHIHGDTGAGPYLSEHRADEIDCTDLWDGEDIDVPDETDRPPSDG